MIVEENTKTRKKKMSKSRKALRINTKHQSKHCLPDITCHVFFSLFNIVLFKKNEKKNTKVDLFLWQGNKKTSCFFFLYFEKNKQNKKTKPF